MRSECDASWVLSQSEAWTREHHGAIALGGLRSLRYLMNSSQNRLRGQRPTRWMMRGEMDLRAREEEGKTDGGKVKPRANG